jgi:hypothetical protein
MSRVKDLGDKLSDYQVGDLIGKGGFAKVFECKCKRTGANGEASTAVLFHDPSYC